MTYHQGFSKIVVRFLELLRYCPLLNNQIRRWNSVLTEKRNSTLLQNRGFFWQAVIFQLLQMQL